MGLIWIVGGAFLGVILGASAGRGSSSILGLFFGGGFGYLLWRLGDLARRLRDSETRLATLERAQLRAGIARSEQRSPGEATLDLRGGATIAPVPATTPPVPASIEAAVPGPVADFDPAPPLPPPPPAPPPAWSGPLQPVSI